MAFLAVMSNLRLITRGTCGRAVLPFYLPRSFSRAYRDTRETEKAYHENLFLTD